MIGRITFDTARPQATRIEAFDHFVRLLDLTADDAEVRAAMERLAYIVRDFAAAWLAKHR